MLHSMTSQFRCSSFCPIMETYFHPVWEQKSLNFLLSTNVVKTFFKFYLLRDRGKVLDDRNKNRTLFSWYCGAFQKTQLLDFFHLIKKINDSSFFKLFHAPYYWWILGMDYSVSILISKPSNKLGIMLASINLYMFNSLIFFFFFHLAFMLLFKSIIKSLLVLKKVLLNILEYW